MPDETRVPLKIYFFYAAYCGTVLCDYLGMNDQSQCAYVAVYELQHAEELDAVIKSGKWLLVAEAIDWFSFKGVVDIF